MTKSLTKNFHSEYKDISWRDILKKKLEKVRKSWDSLQMVFLYQNSEREVAWDLEMNINIVINFNMSVWIEYKYLHTIKEPYILVGRSRWFWSETKNLKYPWDIHNPPKKSSHGHR